MPCGVPRPEEAFAGEVAREVPRGVGRVISARCDGERPEGGKGRGEENRAGTLFRLGDIFRVRPRDERATTRATWLGRRAPGRWAGRRRRGRGERRRDDRRRRRPGARGARCDARRPRWRQARYTRAPPQPRREGSRTRRRGVVRGSPRRPNALAGGSARGRAGGRGRGTACRARASRCARESPSTVSERTTRDTSRAQKCVQHSTPRPLRWYAQTVSRTSKIHSRPTPPIASSDEKPR